MVEQGHGKMIMLDFSGVKGAFILHHEFRAKEIDKHQQQTYVAEQSSVDMKH